MLEPVKEDFMNEPVYTIGHAAEKLGVAVPTLRMYEQAGLILPHRTKTNRRLYSRNDIDRLQTIIDMIRKKHLNIEAIKFICSLTPCWKILNCSLEQRNQCSAYLSGMVPCWLISEHCCLHETIECRDCEVYLSCLDHWKDPKTFLKQFMD